ncbi:S8 family peptidase [Actinomadura sp. DC4]|uniref:S8 family peptidase n=1 Tax=Actinomadura sp. DC4 TaxID=3055069 RepID=UPI0025B15F6A|nr:S8 family peptidase [Actinomadura sp. DC4]MDN3354559.1 S8 family peptidase [Actinomadura sp. DC4]
MKRLAVLPLLAQVLVPTSGTASGQYIVTVRPGVRAMVASGAVTHVFTTVMNGFSARLDAAQADHLRHEPDVLGVEKAVPMHTLDTQGDPGWNLDRLDSDSGLDTKYTYHHTGRGVTAYIIDTGVDPSVSDFGGRASTAFDATGGDGKDCDGHGTHVAGTVGGARYGVAKGVTLKAVRVLDCDGAGTDADVLAGMDWVAKNAEKPAVANLSLGGGKSAAIDAAAKKLTESGVFLAVAAGNEGADACDGSPSGADGVFAVAAEDRADASAVFTDHGTCVKLYAPGVEITSDWPKGGTNTINGTSMAAPHVVGVAALYKEAEGDGSQTAVTGWITSHAVKGAVKGVPAGTPNLLLNTGGL